jgi:hypothetical protein
MTKIEDQYERDAEHAWDVPKVRKCLTCRTPFESEWSGERICKRCKSTAAWKSGTSTVSF